MQVKLVMIALLTVMLSGCGTFKVVPQPVASASIDAKENSIRMSNRNVAATAAYEPIELYSQNLTGHVAAFRVTIENGTDDEFVLEPDSFILLDEQQRQYVALLPAKVKEILTKDTFYLIPYPYVGFYYLEDYEKSTYTSRHSSSFPYYYEVHPEEIFSKAFTVGPIIPRANVSGLVYFNVDVAAHTKLDLLIFKKGTAKSAAPDFRLPFTVQK